jgi:hypothetical protein
MEMPPSPPETCASTGAKTQFTTTVAAPKFDTFAAILPVRIKEYECPGTREFSGTYRFLVSFVFSFKVGSMLEGALVEVTDHAHSISSDPSLHAERVAEPRSLKGFDERTFTVFGPSMNTAGPLSATFVTVMISVCAASKKFETLTTN